MKKAAFYLLAAPLAKMRDLYVCRLVEKAYQNELKVYVYANSLVETQTIDTQLWTFRDISFVPHKIYTANDSSSSLPLHLPSTLIGCIDPPSGYNEVLINLTSTVPTFFADFSHIIEVVPNDENLRQIAREHREQYKESGYETVIHEIQT